MPPLEVTVKIGALAKLVLALLRENRPNLRDALIFGGMACVFYGLHAIFPPAAWVMLGVLLLLTGWRY